MEFQKNEKIRDFVILDKIGSGGMGSVYLARDEMLEREVAIKVLDPVVSKNPVITERFKQEAKVQAGLVHPNIVTLHTFFIENGQYCMIMEYSRGRTLKDVINTDEGIPKDHIIDIFKQILAAVGFAHSKGIIHRDIKPANIIVDEDWNIKVMDFGIAKIIGDRNLTDTGSKIGTIYYMSPEQITASRGIDHRSDIYGLGVTFYEMLTGLLPYENDTSEFMIMREIIERDFPDPRTFDSAIPEVLAQILKKMLIKDPENRYQNCGEILRDIKRLQSSL